jgi:predicted ATPase
VEEKAIESLTIKGFKSIVNLENFSLRNLNVLIGPNGAGKSNFVSFFSMMRELANKRLQNWIAKRGGADRLVSFGVAQTPSITSSVVFRNGESYRFRLDVTDAGGFVFSDEEVDVPRERDTAIWGNTERLSAPESMFPKDDPAALVIFDAIRDWRVFRFHNVGELALVKRKGALHDCAFLRPDGSNLAAFLYKLLSNDPTTYRHIRGVIQLALPFFDDFVLEPEELESEEKLINLRWRQKKSDYVMWPHQLSDGAISFICLATALLQPNPPATIIIDEPELGLHPYAISLLAALLRSTSLETQIIVATQSVGLVNEFLIDDLVIVERENDATVLRHVREADFKNWLADYSVGELWNMNLLGGRP